MTALLSINNYYYRRGGAETVFLEQNRLFEDVGWDVIPFAMQHSKNLHSEWGSYFVDEIEFGQNYTFFKKVSSLIKITYSFEARRKVKQLINHVKPDVAHAHNIYHHLSPSIFELLKRQSIPTALTLHDLKLACPAYKMMTHDGICERCKSGAIWNVVTNKCIKGSLPLSAAIFMETAVHRFFGIYAKNVDRFVVPSRFYLEKFVEWGWPREKFTYVPNFVDVKNISPKGEPGEAFVFFGRLGPEKGLTTFVQAIAKSKTKGWIVGTGPEEDKLKELVRKMDADVEFFGYQSGEALFDLIRSARAMVLPSEWYENAPMSVMEAYALERPVIGADIGGIPELIKVDETGAIFLSGDSDALADKLVHFSKLSTVEIKKMGVNGRNWVEQEFTAEKYRERLLELYRELGVNC